MSRGVAAIRAIAGKFDARFLLHVLRSGYAKFQARGVGSTFINISQVVLLVRCQTLKSNAATILVTNAGLASNALTSLT